MKHVLLNLSFALMSDVSGRAQIQELMIGVHGLTCSHRTRDVELQPRGLPFVADVCMSLELTNGTIRIKPIAALPPEMIAKSVRDAAFPCAIRKIQVQPPAQYNGAGGCFNMAGFAFQAMTGADVSLNDVMIFAAVRRALTVKERSKDAVEANRAGTGKIYFISISND